jgi:hypothetical protein
MAVYLPAAGADFKRLARPLSGLIGGECKGPPGSPPEAYSAAARCA